MAELDVLQPALEGSLLSQSRVLPDHVVVRHTAADFRLVGWETHLPKEIADVRQALLVNPPYDRCDPFVVQRPGMHRRIVPVGLVLGDEFEEGEELFGRLAVQMREMCVDLVRQLRLPVLEQRVARRMEWLDRAIEWLRDEVAERDDPKDLAARLAELRSDLDELLEVIDKSGP